MSSYWVIETVLPKVTKYWSGYFFSPNLENTVRFCRRIDAQRVIDEMFVKSNRYIVAEKTETVDDTNDTK